MKFKFVGGNPCLDFVNTVGNHLSSQQSEYLKSYEDLIAWGVASRVINKREGKKLLETFNNNSAKSSKALRKAIELREILFRILVATALKRDYSPSLIADFNVYLSETLKYIQIEKTGDKFSWEYDKSKNNLEQIIWAITWSAANLLVNENLKFLKVCADNLCGWLFLDTSKNKKRCWCDMKDCGNRNKFRRYYSKNKTKEGSQNVEKK